MAEKRRFFERGGKTLKWKNEEGVQTELVPDVRFDASSQEEGRRVVSPSRVEKQQARTRGMRPETIIGAKVIALHSLSEAAQPDYGKASTADQRPSRVRMSPPRTLGKAA